MKHRLFPILSALSLVLCLACAGMWVRSGFVFDLMAKPYSGGRLWASSGCGSLTLGRDSRRPPPPGWQPGPWAWFAASEGLSLDRGGPYWELKRPACNTTTIGLTTAGVRTIEEMLLPYWLLTLPTVILPAVWFWRRWKLSERKEASLCRVCGYDLRATPDRCPQCGTPAPPPATAPTSSPSDRV